MKTLETVSNTVELETLVNQVLADLQAENDPGKSYAELADSIEKEHADKYGDADIAVRDLVEFLRSADARWFELEG